MKPGARIMGRYDLLELIGKGGEAQVFRARDISNATDVAVRLPLPGLTPSAGTLIAPEFHAGWVRLLDAGTDPEHGLYQVFELLQGETLHQRIQRQPLDVEAWRDFVRQSLDAVGALHDAGWVHGDLNAENFIQIEPTIWKLLELPFLRLRASEKRSAMFGSIHTLAPEQLNGRTADAGSDLYSLGCLYYYAASGEYPHAGGSSQEIAIGRLRFPVAPLREKAPAWAGAWSDWVMPLLEREPDRRPATLSLARQRFMEIA